MMFAIQTTSRVHTAENSYRCSDETCPCQDGHEPAVAGPTSFWPLRPGSTACAWCMDEMGVPLSQRSGSHGICSKHADMLIAASKARREKKARQQ